MADENQKPFIFPFKTIIATLLTLLLGPGVGHLYLRRFKQGLLLISITLFFALHQALRVVKTIPHDKLLKLTTKDVSIFFKYFAADFPQTVFVYDIIFAALWAYALVDVYKKSREWL